MQDAALLRLLGLCATATESDALSAALERAMRDVGRFDLLLETAEEHGIAPLVALHLGNHPRLPQEVRRGLIALSARHALAQQKRTHALEIAVAALDSAGVRHLFFKGAAMAHLVYPRPALRAMRDVDLLVGEDALARAERALADAGFGDRSAAPAEHHEIGSVARVFDGFSIRIDIHRRLGMIALPSYAPDRRQTLEALWEDAQPLTIGAAKTRAPSTPDLVRSVYRHAFCVGLFDSYRWVSIADLATLLARHPEALSKADRTVFFGLRMIHHVTPLPKAALDTLGYRPAKTPSGVLGEYRGFFSDGPSDGAPRRVWMVHTLRPPEWWLRLRHGNRFIGVLGHALAWLGFACELLVLRVFRWRGIVRPHR